MLAIAQRPIGLSLVFSHFRACVKLIGFFILAAIFICHHQIIWWLVRNRQRRLNLMLKSIGRYCQWTLRLLSIEVELAGQPGHKSGNLMVANHLSYIDALVIFSLKPCLFVTSVEIQHTFLLGQLTSLSGCFFVERRKDRRTEERMQYELTELKQHLQHGYNVFFFPEGTSSDGKSVLPFKAHFFQVAMDTQSDVQPLVLRYQGESASIVPWYGKMAFADHLYRICLQDKINSSVKVLPFVQGSLFQDKFDFANQVHQKVKEVYEKH